MIRFFPLALLLSATSLVGQTIQDSPPPIRSGECLATYDKITFRHLVDYTPSEYLKLGLNYSLENPLPWLKGSERADSIKAIKAQIGAIKDTDLAYEVFEGNSDSKKLRISVEHWNGEGMSWLKDFSDESEQETSTRFEELSDERTTLIRRTVIWSPSTFSSQQAHATIEKDGSLSFVSEGPRFSGIITCKK